MSETPDNWNSGSQTMQMHNVETNVGITIWFAAWMIAGSSARPCFQMRVHRSPIITVASSTKMPTANAKPPSVMTLMVCTAQESARIEHGIEGGMDVATISVERPDPKNVSTIRLVRRPAVAIPAPRPEPEKYPDVEASFKVVVTTPAGNTRSTMGELGFHAGE